MARMVGLARVVMVALSALVSGCQTPSAPVTGTRAADIVGVWEHTVIEPMTWRLELTDDHVFTRAFRNTVVPDQDVIVMGTWSAIEPPAATATWLERIGLEERTPNPATVTVLLDYWVPVGIAVPLGATVTDYRGLNKGLLDSRTAPPEVRLRETYSAVVRRGDDGGRASMSLRRPGVGRLFRLIDGHALPEGEAPERLTPPTTLTYVAPAGGR